MDHTYYLDEACDHRYRFSQETFGWNRKERETFMGRVSKWNQTEARRHEARMLTWADRMVRENPSESFRASLKRTPEGAEARAQLSLLGVSEQATTVLMEYGRRNGSSI